MPLPLRRAHSCQLLVVLALWLLTAAAAAATTFADGSSFDLSAFRADSHWSELLPAELAANNISFSEWSAALTNMTSARDLSEAQQKLYFSQRFEALALYLYTTQCCYPAINAELDKHPVPTTWKIS